jgi:hypothetical protein
LNRDSLALCDEFSHIISMDDVVSVIVAFETDLMQHMLSVVSAKHEVRTDLPPIFSPATMRLSPVFVRPAA